MQNTNVTIAQKFMYVHDVYCMIDAHKLYNKYELSNWITVKLCIKCRVNLLSQGFKIGIFKQSSKFAP